MISGDLRKAIGPLNSAMWGLDRKLSGLSAKVDKLEKQCQPLPTPPPRPPKCPLKDVKGVCNDVDERYDEWKNSDEESNVCEGGQYRMYEDPNASYSDRKLGKTGTKKWWYVCTGYINNAEMTPKYKCDAASPEAATRHSMWAHYWLDGEKPNKCFFNCRKCSETQ